MNPNKALWEKGDFTRLAQSMRESGDLRAAKSVKPDGCWVSFRLAQSDQRVCERFACGYVGGLLWKCLGSVGGLFAATSGAPDA